MALQKENMNSFQLNDEKTELDLAQIRKNLEIQLEELETLESMYCNPGELRVEDLDVLADIRNFVSGRADFIPHYLDIVINLPIDGVKFEICVTLPHDYPGSKPEIFVRNDLLNRVQHKQLHEELDAIMDYSQPCIFTVTSWLSDNASKYIIIKEEPSKKTIEKNEPLVRYWIYSHHIYSKTKRKEIQDTAADLKITGFCMPGKPGIICVEGFESDVSEWWMFIKSMNWKKIFCKVNEECKDRSEDFLKFNTFQEVVFQNSGVKCNHMDMGELYKFLEKHKCGYVFKDIFGVDAKSN